MKTKRSVVFLLLAILSSSFASCQPRAIRAGFKFNGSQFNDLDGFEKKSDSLRVDITDLVIRSVRFQRGQEVIEVEIFVGQSSRGPVEKRMTQRMLASDLEANRYLDLANWEHDVGDFSANAHKDSRRCSFIRDNIGVRLSTKMVGDFARNGSETKVELEAKRAEANKRYRSLAKDHSFTDLTSLAEKIDTSILATPLTKELTTPISFDCEPRTSKLVRGTTDLSELNRGLASIPRTTIDLTVSDINSEKIRIIEDYKSPFSVRHSEDAIDVTFVGQSAGRHQLQLWAVNESLIAARKTIEFTVEIRVPEENFRPITLTTEEEAAFMESIRMDFDAVGKTISEEELQRRSISFGKEALEKRKSRLLKTQSTDSP